MAGPYDDETPTEDELKEMDEADRTRALPPPDSSDELLEGDAGGDDDSSAEPTETPAEAEPAAVEGDDEGDAAGDAEAELSGFLEKHKGKSPEDLLKLAFQQQKRANRAEFDRRKSNENLSAVLTKIQEKRDEKINAAAKKREEFRAKVETDPDAALLEAHEQSIAEREANELKQLDDEEFSARAAAAIELASAVIPDFQTRAPQIRNFGVEMGFSPQEVDGIVDGRQIVTLHLASIAGRMMQAGIIDTSGRFVSLPEASQEQPAANAPRGSGFNRAPARATNPAKSIDQQLADLDAMDDDAFDQLSDELVNSLLKADAAR